MNDEADRVQRQLEAAEARYKELRAWVTEALNTYPGAPTGKARTMLLNALIGVTRHE